MFREEKVCEGRERGVEGLGPEAGVELGETFNRTGYGTGVKHDGPIGARTGVLFIAVGGAPGQGDGL